MGKNFIKTGLMGLAIGGAAIATEAEAQTITNDSFWKTVEGNTIYSQGGGVLKAGDTYYWYGVKYNGAVTYAANPTSKNSDTGFLGVTCYSSKDLVNWKDEGIVLASNQAAAGWFGRIGVVYNSKTKKYVLAGQGGSPSYSYGEYFATSSSPTGPFTFNNVQTDLDFLVNNGTGDQTLFQDDDGKAYVICSNVNGRTNLYVSPLRESDFLAMDSASTVKIHKSTVGGREGNAMFKHDGVYYFCSSDLHGWNTSQTYCMSATNILGPYSEEFVLEGTQYDFSYVTQTGFFIMVNGTEGSFVVNAGDRWSDFAGNGLGFNQWLPISFETGKPVFHSLSQWNIDAAKGIWSVGDNNNYCLNPTFEADRVSQTTLTGWNLTGADTVKINSTSKKRTGRWGLYLKSNKTLSQTLTVPNGKYTLSAYVQSSGGQTATMFAKDFGSSEKNTSIAAAASAWTEKKVEEINVTNGKITIGFSTAGTNDQWVAVDDITLIKSSKTYKVNANAGIGGYIQLDGVTVSSSATVSEGANATFTAVPLAGWEFEKWAGNSAETGSPAIEGANLAINSANADIDLSASFKFIGTDSLKYEAENTVYNQAVLETTHEGFSGEGYANLDNAIGSSITFAVCLPTAGEKKVKIVYANGGKADRPVSVTVNDSMQVPSISMDTTGGWENWTTIETTLNMPAGASSITFASLTTDGAANIDYIEFEGEKVEETPSDSTINNGGKDAILLQKTRLNQLRSGRTFFANGRSANNQLRRASRIKVYSK